MTPSVLWSRAFLNQQDNLFDEDLQAAQEWEFHLRVLNMVPAYEIMDIPLVFIRKHKKGITYDENKSYREYHYFLARLKIYRNTKLTMGKKANSYLRQYLLNSLKKMIRRKNPYAYKAFKKYIISGQDFDAYAKINAFLAILCFTFFDRGNMFLSAIKYK